VSGRTAARPGGAPAFRIDGLGAAIILLAVLGAIAVGRVAADPSAVKVALAATAVPLAFGLGFLAPRVLLLALPCWLVGLGVLRRVAALSASPSKTDLLLVVAPVAWTILVLVAARRGAFSHPTTLSKGVLALSLLAVASSLVPVNGSFIAGPAGLIFVLVPMLAFWVGRGLVGDRTLATLLKLVALLAVAAVLYGLTQTVYGFRSWDLHWIRTSGYAALNVNGVIRPFATFSSAAEYAYFAGVAVVVWLAFWLRPGRIVVTLAAVGLLGTGIAYEGSRGIVVSLVAAVGLMLGARRGIALVPAAIGAVVLVLVLSFAVRHVVPSGYEGSGSSTLLAHQAQGIANPLDPKSSTLLVHLTYIVHGLGSAVTHPLGQGVAAVTIAGSRFGGQAKGTEADPSNAAVALGLPGLLAYLVIAVSGIALAYRTAVRRGDALSLVALGVLSVTLFQWLNGGQYAVAFLPWLVLGWLDRSRLQAPAPEG
jgi:hypothetical protein